MDAVLLFSHGSVLCGSGEALLGHAELLRAAGRYPIVEIGYLNYTAPPFIEAVERCAEQNATRIVIVPYFLVPGKFVSIDLPKAIEAARLRYPHIEFTVAAEIGFDPLLADAILASAADAAGPDRWLDDLNRAAKHCLDNPKCPLYGSAACPHAPVDGALAERL